jgi:hypothetical protein
MLDTQKYDSNMITMVVLIVLAVLMIGWGWMRAHAAADLNPVSAPPKGTRSGVGPSTE